MSRTEDKRGSAAYLPSWTEDCGGNPTVNELLDDIDENTQAKAFVTIGEGAGDDYVTDGTADYVQIKQAITDVIADGGGTILVKTGEYDVEQAFVDSNSAMRLGSNTKFMGVGRSTVLKNDFLGPVYTSTLGTIGGADNVEISDLMVDGNNDNISEGSRSGHNVNIEGSGPGNYAENGTIARILSVSGINGFRFQYVKNAMIDTCTSYNNEHGLYLFRSFDIQVLNFTAMARAYGSHIAFMQRGIFINQCNGVNIVNYVGKDMYAVGILIRSYNDSESGQDASSPICKNINITNPSIYTTSELQTMTGGISFLTSDTDGVSNINITGGSIDVGRGPAFTFLRGPNDGLGGAGETNKIPVRDVQVTNMTLRQRKMGASSWQSTIEVYGYRDDVGAFEPTYYAADKVTFTNVKIYGIQPANLRWLKNITFIGCHFEVETGSDAYAALSFKHCTNIKLLLCTFKSLNGGLDLSIDNTNTGSLTIIGCEGLTGYSSIDDSGFTTTEYNNNIGLVDIGYTSLKRKTVILTAAQVLALQTTPITIVPAQGSGTYISVESAFGYLLYDGVQYTSVGAGDNLFLRYRDATGYIVKTFTGIGFLDQTASNTKIPTETTTAMTPVANSPIVAHLGGQILTGNSRVRLDVFYRVITS